MKKNLFQQIGFWFWNTRPQALMQSVMPTIVAICLAWSYGGFSWWLALLAFLGVVLAHSGFNLFDDYFDYRKTKSDYRDHLVHEGFRARIGKCPYLTSGEATVGQLLFVSCLLVFLALVCGLVILYFRGLNILWFILILGFLGLEYSGAPLRLSYHGLGELTIGFIFGPLAMTGVFYAACGVFDPLIVVLSVPIGLLVANILYVHSILDYEPDKKIGKRTLAVLLNNKRWMLVALFLILFIPYATIVYGILRGFVSPWYWLLFLTLPMAISLFYLMMEFVRDPKKEFTPKFWMGPMGQWKRISESGIQWFMIRWYLSRNLISFFCLIIIIVSFIA